MMTLDQAIRQLDTFDEEAFLCARKPWGPAAECVVVMPNDDLTVPKETMDAGFVYFLEVHEARDLLDDLGDEPRRTWDDRVYFVIHYAEHDTYPDWK